MCCGLQLCSSLNPLNIPVRYSHGQSSSLPSNSLASPSGGHTQSLSSSSRSWPVVAPLLTAPAEISQMLHLFLPCQNNTKSSLCRMPNSRRTDYSFEGQVLCPFPQSDGVLYKHPGSLGVGLPWPCSLLPVVPLGHLSPRSPLAVLLSPSFCVSLALLPYFVSSLPSLSSVTKHKATRLHLGQRSGQAVLPGAPCDQQGSRGGN